LQNILRNFWYLAVRGETLRPGTTMPLTLLGEPILIGRRKTGEVFAFADRCPHRGMPLRHARFEDDALRCCFHGWKFDLPDGRCVEIPGLDLGQQLDTRRFRLRVHPCREVQGNVWVFVPEREENPPVSHVLPPVPTVPIFGDAAPQVGATMRFPCPVDQAVIGFFDPAHPPFVHTSRWWKSRPAALRAKVKHYGPTAFGFQMKRHALNGGALPYRILGRDPTVEVTIQLPGIRIEHIAGTRHSACVLAAATPVDKVNTDVHYCVYWTPGWAGAFKPMARWMTRQFLRQDRDVAAKLAGAAEEPPLFVGDPDAQIGWYYRLKREYQNCRTERRPFVNPVTPRTLHWRS
jgi:phenylpropionate dioxygenase-like ring-hydroxylating dioxygenase large terminal subunit